MKKKEKIVYYTDEISDDFSGNKIKTKQLKENFKYVKRNPFHHAMAWLLYYVFAVPFGSLFCWLKLRTKVKNKKALKGFRRKGIFVYANHTQKGCDAFLPALAVYPKRNYVMVHKDAVSIKGLKNIVLMLGGIPVANTLNNMRLMKGCVEKRIRNKHSVTIYPEASIWPYNTQIRNFKDTSFRYPVELDSPVFAQTIVYRKRNGISKLWSDKPFATIYIDGPFFADKSLPKKEATKKLRDEVYNAMVCRADVPENYAYIKYVKKEDENAQ